MSADSIPSALEQATTLPDLVEACDDEQAALLQEMVTAWLRARITDLTPERKREIIHEITYGATPPCEVCGGRVQDTVGDEPGDPGGAKGGEEG
jgi:hypothetical protein